VSCRDARRFVRGFAAGHGLDAGLADSAELALSEVVTNAILHAHTGFDVALSLEVGGRLRVEVTDRSPALPVQRDHSAQATTGRGMELVAAYTDDCGVRGRGPTGKTVWFVVSASGDAQEQSEQDLIDAWGVDLDVSVEDDTAAGAAGATGGAGETAVVLLGLPPTLWLAAGEHHDALLRELALYFVEHPDQALTPDRIAVADRARTWVSTRLLAELDQRDGAGAAAHHVLPMGHPSPLPDTPESLDLVVAVPLGFAEAFGALQDVLDAAERCAAAGLLLARPGLPEVVAVRDWACEQAIAQHAGVPPSPWPGTGQECFTHEVHDRDEPATPDWDARVVTVSERGAVAADDANRIIAISRPLARSLGWAVEDLVGRRVVVLIPPELREAHVAGFTRHLTTGATHVLGVPLRLPVQRADGTRVECDFLIEQSPATTGRVVYVAWIQPVPAVPAPPG